MPLVMRTRTFLTPPLGPTTTSSSFIGVLAQNGSAPRLIIFMSGGLPVSVTVPLTSAVPALMGAGAAAALAPSAAPPAAGAGAACGVGAGAGAASFFSQDGSQIATPATQAAASAS